MTHVHKPPPQACFLRASSRIPSSQTSFLRASSRIPPPQTSFLWLRHAFLPHRRLLIRAVNSFPIVRKYQLESTCQIQKQSYLSLHLTKFRHTCTKIIRKSFSIQGVNYFLRAVKKIPCRQ